MGYCADVGTSADGQTTTTCTRPPNHRGLCRDNDGRRWQHSSARIADELRARLAATDDHDCNQWCTPFEHHNI